MKEKTTLSRFGISLVCFLMLTGATKMVAQSFTNVSASAGLDLSGAKDGGFCWADFNQDGFLDLLVNTNNATGRSRLYYSNGGATFTDVTTSRANDLLLTTTERGAVAGDIDNDGDIDFVRNTAPACEVYRNSGAPNYRFTRIQLFNASFFTGTQTGMNTEGLGLIDFNGDGFLDIMLEDHQYGIDLMLNDGTGTFSHFTTDANPRGFPTTGVSGDYASVTDLNNDGYVDLIARREGTAATDPDADIFMNNGNNTFSRNTTTNLNASNSNKGGIVVADFDNDGDFDYFWTDNGTGASPNACFLVEQTGVNTGVFQIATVTVSGSSSSLPNAGLIDGVTVGDIDNDGRQDLFMTANSGTSFLYLNKSTGAGNFSFQHNNLGINVNADGEGCEFIDYDNDGDLDLYVNVNNGNNQLWRNTFANTNYLKVRPMINLGGGLTRPAIGATVSIKSCTGTVVSGLQEVSGGSGHGTQKDQILHFGLPSGSGVVYQVEVSFVRPNGGTRKVVKRGVTPSALASQTLVVTSTDVDNLVSCALLPVEIQGLKATVNSQDEPVVSWTSARETNSSHFIVERSYGNGFEPAGRVDAAGESGKQRGYSFTDQQARAGQVYYRLKAVDKDGSYTISEIVKLLISAGNAQKASLYPNPTRGALQVKLPASWTQQSLVLTVTSQTGQVVARQSVKVSGGIASLDLARCPNGVYFVQVLGQGTDALYREKIMIAH